MNSIYIYDDDFESLLKLINYLIKNNIRPCNIKNQEYSPTLLDNLINLEIIEDYIELKNNLPKSVFNTIFYVFLSHNENKELIIYYFVLNSLKYKSKIFDMRNLRCVNETLKLSHQVSRENHRFKGFTRFKELENKVLYAEIEPDNNILVLLSNHFKKRLKNEYFIIHDKKRHILSIYDKKTFYIIDDENLKIEETIKNEEKEIEKLWKTFYNTIGIKERKNERCRMNFMPKKYWKNILEMSDKCEESDM